MNLEKGLRQYPSSVILLLTTGEVHSQCGDMAKSIKLFQKACELDQYHPLPYLNAARGMSTLSSR
jgi:hypothetical protein